MGAVAVGDLHGELFPARQDVAASRDQAAAVAFDDPKALKPSCLISNSQSGWSNGSGIRTSGMGRGNGTAGQPTLVQTC